MDSIRKSLFVSESRDGIQADSAVLSFAGDREIAKRRWNDRMRERPRIRIEFPLFRY